MLVLSKRDRMPLVVNFKATGNREPDRVGCCRLSELRKNLLLGAEGERAPVPHSW